MAIYHVTQLDNAPKGIQSFAEKQKRISSPFQVFVSSIHNYYVNIKVSKYSAIVDSPDVLDSIPIVGLDYPIYFEYGNKVWLEVFYDKNLVPVCGFIETGVKWLNKTLDISGDSSSLVYPKQIELIRKNDLSDRISEIEAKIAKAELIRSSLLQELQTQNTNGFISEGDLVNFTAEINYVYDTVNSSLTEYLSDLGAFFSSSSSTQRKQFKSYTMIAYSSLDDNDLLYGESATPTIDVNQAPQAIIQATDDQQFKIVQCLNSDLLLADCFYQNRYPIRLPIPYSRPIYYKVLGDGVEEVLNTKD